MSDLLLNISSTVSHSRANGPGLRAVVWVQGCSIGCKGCYSVSTHSHTKNSLFEPYVVSDWLLSLNNIEGVTFSGGEPFEQAAAVLEVIKLVRKQRPNFTVFIFSGYNFKFLNSSSNDAVIDLLNQCDMVSTGPYIDTLQDTNLLWRGSQNQELHYLSDVYSSTMEKQWAVESPIEEYSLIQDKIHFTGFGGESSKFLRMARNNIA